MPKGLFGKSKIERTLRDLQARADAGDANSQFQLGQMCEDGDGVEQDYALAFNYYRQAANQGHQSAIAQCGYLLACGYGVRRDIDEAIRLFKISAKAGNPLGLMHLGRAYYSGDGLPKNLDKAKRCLDEAAKSGYAPAERAYAAFLEANPVKYGRFEHTALYWYMRAAEHGDVESMYQAGRLFYDEDGPWLDYKRAFNMFEKAANRGHVEAMTSLGIMYFNGDYRNRNPGIAHRWLMKAARNGDTYAKKILNDEY